VDTLITAVATVAVNDVYRPYLRPRATEAQQLRAARFTAVGVTLFGIALVPVFSQFKTIYEAHGAMTAAVTPPLVVALFLSVFWRRYTARAAFWTIVGGLAAIVLSIFLPSLVAPFAHGVPAGTTGEGLFAGMQQYKFMRALYGLVVSGVIGVAVTWFTAPEPVERQRGLVWGTVRDAIARYKGSPGEEGRTRVGAALPRRGETEPPLRGEGQLPVVQLGARTAADLEATTGDLLFVSDSRWWLGGLKSAHVIVGAVDGEEGVLLGPDTYADVVSPGRAALPLRIERLY